MFTFLTSEHNNCQLNNSLNNAENEHHSTAVAVFSRTGVRTQDVVRKGFDGFEDVNQFWAGGSLRRCLHVLYSLPLKPDLLHVHCAVLSHSSY